MTVKYNVTGSRRKELVLTIANWTGCEAKYLGAPTFAYEVDYFTIDKNGTLIFDDRADSEVIERLLEMLYDNGFEAEGLPETDAETEPECEMLEGVIYVLKEIFTETSMDNLKKLITAKGNLIKKALGIDNIELTYNKEYVGFPWISDRTSPDDIFAITEFISALCEMARTQKRITAQEREVENEKYAFRCLLLRLGFIGNEYKSVRKILLKNFEGSSAYKSGKKKESEAV